MQNSHKMIATLVPEEDLIFRILEAAGARLSFRDVCMLTEIRHELAKAGKSELLA